MVLVIAPSEFYVSNVPVSLRGMPLHQAPHRTLGLYLCCFLHPFSASQISPRAANTPVYARSPDLEVIAYSDTLTIVANWGDVYEVSEAIVGDHSMTRRLPI